MAQRYAWPLRVLHWLIAVLIIGTIGVGLYMTDMSLSPLKLKTYSWHKWAGVTIFFLAAIRLVVRACTKSPPYPTHMGAGARFMAGAGHIVLYVLMLSIPLSGWLMSSAAGFQTVWFGVIPLPDLLSKNVELSKNIVVIHSWLNWTLIFMLVAHVLAALKHQFIDKDSIFSRII